MGCFTGKMPGPFTAPYSSTKFALNGFFGTLSHELAMTKSNVSLSICTLGLIDTESAMEKVRLVKSYKVTRSHHVYCCQPQLWSIFLCRRGVVSVPAYPATDAALNIIITGATRQHELFYPWFTQMLTLSKDWFPSISNYFIQNSYNYIPWETLILLWIYFICCI